MQWLLTRSLNFSFRIWVFLLLVFVSPTLASQDAVCLSPGQIEDLHLLKRQSIQVANIIDNSLTVSKTNRDCSLEQLTLLNQQQEEIDGLLLSLSTAKAEIESLKEVSKKQGLLLEHSQRELKQSLAKMFLDGIIKFIMGVATGLGISQLVSLFL